MKCKYDRSLGMLLGLHVGDSLGATLEFCEPRTLDNLHTDITGGGAFKWIPGEPTDDTLMMILLLESLISSSGKVDIEDIALKYVDWLNSNPKDIGSTVSSALSRIKNGASPFTSGLTHEGSQGNGSLMRCAPLALFNISNEDIANQSKITHAHLNCIACDIIFISSLRDLIRGHDKEFVFNNALRLSTNLSPDLHKALSLIKNLSWEEITSTGYVIDTLAFAFWGLLSTNSFEEALINVVNRGGDADTLGAVCGALCGAHYGVNGIPQKWRSGIEKGEYAESLFSSSRFFLSRDY